MQKITPSQQFMITSAIYRLGAEFERKQKMLRKEYEAEKRRLENMRDSNVMPRTNLNG